MQILHVFADRGAEDPTLSRHGDVYRFSIGPTPNQWSETVKADANVIPIDTGVTFDLGLLHPPCGLASPMSDTGRGSRDDWPNLVPVAREIAREYCDHWIIENKPGDHIDEDVILDGHMFQLGIKYERAFECSFPVNQPPRQNRIADTSPFFYSEKPKGWWASVKQSSMVFGKEHLAKDTIPGVYIDYLMGQYYEHTSNEDLPDYSDYDREMYKRRSEETNKHLSDY